MTVDATSNLFSDGAANTCYLTIPAAMAMNSEFPFEDDQEVLLRIDGERLVVESLDTTEGGT